MLNVNKDYDNNGGILIECKTLQSVVTSAAEAETHGVFHNAKMTILIRNILEAMGHKQVAPTPLKTNNSTAAGYVNNNMQMKRSKTWDMHLHFLRELEKQNIFNLFWEKKGQTMVLTISLSTTPLFITGESALPSSTSGM